MAAIIKMSLILMVFCLVSAASLSYMNQCTDPVISKRLLSEADEARRDLLSGDFIDLLDIPDGTYDFSAGKDTLKLMISEHRIKENDGKITGGPDQIKAEKALSEINQTQKIPVSSSDPSLNRLYSAIKKALQSCMKFDRFLVVSFQAKDQTDPRKTWTVRLPYFLDHSGKLVFLGGESGFEFTLDTVTQSPVFLSLNGKKISEMSSTFTAGKGIADVSCLKNPDFSWYYIGKIGETRLGAVTVCAPKGYSGPVNFMAAFGMDGKVKGVKVLSHTETPGLGAKITEINPLLAGKISSRYNNPLMKTDRPWFTEQFKGLNLSSVFLSRDNSDGKIDAITAATISSRAVTGGLRQKLDEFILMKDSFSVQGDQQ